MQRITSNQLSHGMVSVAFDDGWKSTYKKALPLLKKYNIRTTQYIVSGFINGKDPNYMNAAEITALKNAGSEIGSHSVQHCNVTLLPKPALQQMSETSFHDLSVRWGKIQSFAYPFGSYNETTQSVLRQRYQYIRSTDVGYNDRYFDPYDIRSMTVRSNTSARTVQDWLTYAATHHKWVVIVYHGVDMSSDYSVGGKQLDRQLRLIKNSGLNILPLSEAAQAIQFSP
jgi:peptidoglycan/xylan/chitin deacetylase (PgdA/CDA1 family)